MPGWRLAAGRLPRDSRALYRFFEWSDPKCILFMHESFVSVADDVILVPRRMESDMPLVRIDHLCPEDDDTKEVGYAIYPKASMSATAAYVHIGTHSGGKYEHRAGMHGIQAYTGDLDTVLVSTGAGDSYIERVRADIIT